MLLSLIYSITFGIIDAILFLTIETIVQNKFLLLSFFDLNMAELLSGGLSAAIALAISTLLNNIIKQHYTIITSPIYDFIGILLGTIFILIIYYLFLKKKK